MFRVWVGNRTIVADTIAAWGVYRTHWPITYEEIAVLMKPRCGRDWVVGERLNEVRLGYVKWEALAGICHHSTSI